MADGNQKKASKIIIIIRSIAGIVFITLALIFISIAAYALWDLGYTAKKASPVQYEIYKPVQEKASFDELIAKNDDVFAWINIYGTNIDYPVVQGQDNDKYVTTNPENKYSMSGSIFLDYRNKRDFTDFNNIIYGHSMSQNVMFGDISDFSNDSFFDEHRYGDLFFEGEHHGLVIVGFAQEDAYKSKLYNPLINTDAEKGIFLKNLVAADKFGKVSDFASPDNTYVLLSTCTSSTTNGRHILICMLTDEVYDNPFGKETRTKDTVDSPRQRYIFLLIISVIICALVAALTIIRKAGKRK